MACEVVRDLLPLYADDACSKQSRALVEEHLRDCPKCAKLLSELTETEIETGLRSEKDDVLRYGEKKLRRRSAAVGAAVAGLFMIPVLVCLIVNLASGHALDWFFVVLASLLVASSLIIVPLMMPEDKLFWTFCSFCACLVVLLAVVCLYSGGSWFWIASSASLFGLGVIFLPFVIRARPVRRLIGGGNKWLIVGAADAVLFINMMNMITSRGGVTIRTIVFAAGMIAGIAVVVLEIMRKRSNEK